VRIFLLRGPISRLRCPLNDAARVRRPARPRAAGDEIFTPSRAADAAAQDLP
jgi:hypothetical protein